ncbi:hypothetical protein A6456_17845 [Paraburkholderia tropica]|nr:hypothetical protein A6456_17845 [Paraburkholderia tropica]
MSNEDKQPDERAAFGWPWGPREPTTKMLREMAYELKLAPEGDVVCVQFLDVLRKQYKAAFNAARATQQATTGDERAALTAADVERQYRDGVHIGSGLPRATCPCGFCAKHRHGFNQGDAECAHDYVRCDSVCTECGEQTPVAWEVTPVGGIRCITVSEKIAKKHNGRALVYADTTPSPVAGSAGQAASRDAEISQLIDERDSFEHMGTKLAEKVSELLNVDVGEWSNSNNPIFCAIHAIEDRLAAPIAAPNEGSAGQALLSDDALMAAITSVCAFDAEQAEKWRPEALAIGRAVERAVRANSAAPTAPSLTTDAGAVLTDEQIKQVWKRANGTHPDNGQFGCMVVDFAHALLAAHPTAQRMSDALRDAEDTARLDWLREECCDLRSISVPTGGDDADVNWIVIQHHMAQPREREIGRGFSDDPRAAIDAARKAEIERQGGEA